MPNQRKAYLFAFASVLCWSTVATAFKITLRFISPTELVFYSSFFSLFILFLSLLISGKIKDAFIFNKKQFLLSILMGLLNPFAYYLVLFKAYDLLDAQIAQPLNYTWGIVVVILSIIFLKQKITIKNIIAIIISFIGVIIISTRGNLNLYSFQSIEGTLLAIGSSLIWSSFWILNLVDKRDARIKLFLSFLISLLPTFLLKILVSGWSLTNFNGILGAFYIGTFEMGLTFIFWIKALENSQTTALISNIIYLSPFISLIFIHFVLGEDIHQSSVFGLVLIIIGIIIQQSQSRKLTSIS